jgi:hypothetical protein
MFTSAPIIEAVRNQLNIADNFAESRLFEQIPDKYIYYLIEGFIRDEIGYRQVWSEWSAENKPEIAEVLFSKFEFWNHSHRAWFLDNIVPYVTDKAAETLESLGITDNNTSAYTYETLPNGEGRIIDFGDYRAAIYEKIRKNYHYSTRPWSYDDGLFGFSIKESERFLPVERPKRKVDLTERSDELDCS